MAIAGNNTWIPSNQIKLVDGELRFTTITQNKPRNVLERNVSEAARRLLAGETVTMEVRHEFMSQVREVLQNGRTDSVSSAA
ncbi:MAG: hypothetical protein KF753_05125 [Caldilineaceae bacterium]|nr:hypothetical protein [Caldilineaceae bacterium]